MFREADKLLEEVIRKATAALAAPTPQAHHGVAPLTVSAHRVSQWLAAAPASAASAESGLLAGKPSYARFQLEHFGPWLPRPRGKPDARVQFPLDTWQVRAPFLHDLVMTVHFIAPPFFGVQEELVTHVDQGRSVAVVAATSAGKTFIAYYVSAGAAVRRTSIPLCILLRFCRPLKSS
jgi:hypothetical protein